MERGEIRELHPAFRFRLPSAPQLAKRAKALRSMWAAERIKFYAIAVAGFSSA